MVAAWLKIAILALKAPPASKKTAATSPKRVLRASKCVECQNAHQGSGILQEAQMIGFTSFCVQMHPDAAVFRWVYFWVYSAF
jgi:hypothetical protein